MTTAPHRSRVLFLALGVYTGEGGIQRFNRRVIRSLDEFCRADRVEHVAIVSLWDGATGRQHSADDVEYYPCRSSKIRMAYTVTRLLSKRRYDVVVFGHLLLVPFGCLVRLIRPRSSQALFVHGVEAWDRPGPLTRAFVRWWMNPVIAVSRHTAGRMAATFGLPSQRFTILPCAVDSTGSCDQSHRKSAPVRPLRLVTVSRLVRGAPDKNVDKVVAAMPAILSRHPSAEYVVIGDGDLRPELEGLAGRLGVAESIRFLGPASDATRDQIYAESDVFVLPSTREGFGIVFLEAWRHGLPVVGADAGASPELIGDGKAGLSVAPEPDSIAEAVSALFANPQLRLTMADEGRRRVNEDYSHERFRQRLGEILATVRESPCR